MKQTQKNQLMMDTEQFHRTKLQREMVIERLRERGFRITRQRLTLLDIILENDCTSCKEIFYQAVKIEHHIGVATVYRLVNILEEIGAISRKNMYKLTYPQERIGVSGTFVVTLEDGTVRQLSAKEWAEVIRMGLNACGYLEGKRVLSVETKIAEDRAPI